MHRRPRHHRQMGMWSPQTHRNDRTRTTTTHRQKECLRIPTPETRWHRRRRTPRNTASRLPSRRHRSHQQGRLRCAPAHCTIDHRPMERTLCRRTRQRETHKLDGVSAHADTPRMRCSHPMNTHTQHTECHRSFETDAPLHFALGSGGLSTSMCSIKDHHDGSGGNHS